MKTFALALMIIMAGLIAGTSYAEGPSCSKDCVAKTLGVCTTPTAACAAGDTTVTAPVSANPSAPTAVVANAPCRCGGAGCPSSPTCQGNCTASCKQNCTHNCGTCPNKCQGRSTGHTGCVNPNTPAPVQSGSAGTVH